jgi:aryl sulfotransferase
MGEDRDHPPGPASAAAPLFRYTSPDEDSARWWDFAFRPGDIVVSTRSKSGTTWVQMICLLLVFATPDLPGRLSALSPWLDWLVQPKGEVAALLEAQTHRRVIKTHTPLDGVPLDDRATYIVVGRHPLDVAVSLYHHSDNIDRRRMAELTGQPEAPRRTRPPLHEWLLGFIDWEGDTRAWLDTLPGAMLHLSDAWARRHDPNVVLVHYDDLVRDLDGAMRRLSGVLGIPVDEARWPALVPAATFDAMRESAGASASADLGVLKDPAAFFRHGVSGDGRALLSADELVHYRDRVVGMAPVDMLAWLHRDGMD